MNLQGRWLSQSRVDIPLGSFIMPMHYLGVFDVNPHPYYTSDNRIG